MKSLEKPWQVNTTEMWEAQLLSNMNLFSRLKHGFDSRRGHHSRKSWG